MPNYFWFVLQLEYFFSRKQYQDVVFMLISNHTPTLLARSSCIQHGDPCFYRLIAIMAHDKNTIRKGKVCLPKSKQGARHSSENYYSQSIYAK